MLGHLINDFDFSSFYVSFWPALGSWYLKTSQSLLQGLLKSICILLSPLPLHKFALCALGWEESLVRVWLVAGLSGAFLKYIPFQGTWDLGGFHTLWTNNPVSETSEKRRRSDPSRQLSLDSTAALADGRFGFQRVTVARFSEFMSIIKYSVEDRLLRWQASCPTQWWFLTWLPWYTRMFIYIEKVLLGVPHSLCSF